MTPRLRLVLVRALHTAIYVVMVSAIIAILYAGVSGDAGAWLWGALALVGLEVAIFAASGLKCPLTAVATRYGAEEGHDTFFPEAFTRHTAAIFGPLIVLGLCLLAARWAGWLNAGWLG